MTLPAVCKTLNRFIHFEHEQIDSANHFYRTVSITIYMHNPQWFDNVSINFQAQLPVYFYVLSLICILRDCVPDVNVLLIQPHGCHVKIWFDLIWFIRTYIPFCHRTIKFDVVTHNIMEKGLVCRGQPRPNTRGGVPALPNFGVPFYLCVHPLSQNYESWRRDTRLPCIPRKGSSRAPNFFGFSYTL